MYTLEFQDLSFRPGYNTTCRLGKKHLHQMTNFLAIGDTLRLTDLDGTNIIYAKLVSVEAIGFKDQTATMIATNHIARDYRQLYKAMKKAYGKWFNEEEQVTIIGFDIEIV